VIIVPPERLSEIWPKVEAWIGQAVERNQGDENLLDVLIACSRGHYALWYEKDQFAVVAQVLHHPQQRVATILYAGGTLEGMLPMWGEAKNWCRQNGIQVIRMWGREGWEKVLGIKRVGVILQEYV
jgi:hypothetical protein